MAEIAARQALNNCVELGIDQVEVVEQPQGRRTRLIARYGQCCDGRMGLAQHGDIAAQPGEKARRWPMVLLGNVHAAQTAAMLSKALRPKDFGTKWRK